MSRREGIQPTAAQSRRFALARTSEQNVAKRRERSVNPGVASRLAKAHGPQATNPSVCRALSNFCFLAGLTSILASIGIWWFLDHHTPDAIAHAERFRIFVGLWTPTLLILLNFFDLYADKARPLP